MRKITGRFCERTLSPRSALAKGSLRWRKSSRGRSWILFGCPKGKWQPRMHHCKGPGMRIHKLLVRAGKAPCKKGRKITKSKR